MKLNPTKVTLFLFGIIISACIVNSTVLRAPGAANASPCEKSCEICQRVVYQMKFQQMADCEVGGVCRDTCYKIQEVWNTNWSPFKPFMSDQFGKCEICFRAGYCTISQCKEQELKEIDVINRVVNQSTITGKVDENLLKNLPELKNVSPKDIKTTSKNNDQLAKIISQQVTTAIKNHSTEDLVPKIQSLIKSYFSEPFAVPQGNIREILYAHQPMASAADITYWNQQATSGVQKTTTYTHNLTQRLDSTINGLIKAKNGAKKGQSEIYKKTVRATKANIAKILVRYEKASKKLSAKEASLKKAVKSNKGSNSAVESALDESLAKIQDYLSVVMETKDKLKSQSKRLNSL